MAAPLLDLKEPRVSSGMSKQILLFAPKRTYRLQDFLAAARKLDIHVILASDRCKILADMYPQENVVAVSFSHPDRTVTQIKEQIDIQSISAVLAADDAAAIPAARVAQALGLPFNRPSAIRKSRNKFMFRHAMAKAGLPSPPFHLAAIHKPPETILPQVRFPCVLKPLMLSGSQGVIRADDPDGFVHAFLRIRHLLEQPEMTQHCNRAFRYILIEDYIPGDEYAVEAILTRGQVHLLTIFDKPEPLIGPYFEETIYVTPSRLPAESRQRLQATLESACRVLGLHHGPIHAEVRINPKGIFLLEIAPRTIGGLCSRALRFASDMSLEELVLRHALGEPPADLSLQRQTSGVMMIPIPEKGVLKHVHGVEEARAVPGIVDVQITFPLNHELIPLPEGSSYLGFMFARGASPEAVVEALQAAHAKLRFDILPSLSVVDGI